MDTQENKNVFCNNSFLSCLFCYKTYSFSTIDSFKETFANFIELLKTVVYYVLLCYYVIVNNFITIVN